MGGSRLLLIKTLLRATGSFNRLGKETDKKKRGRLIGGMVGILILYILLGVFCVAMSVLMCFMGSADSAPVMVGIIVSALGFISGLLRSNGYLFAARDYNTLMSLPFSEWNIVSAKIISMYIHNIGFSLVLSYSTLIGYVIVLRPGALTVILWAVLTPFLPLIPMVVGSLIGALAAAVGSGFKHKSVIQSILIFAVSIGIIVVTQIFSHSLTPDKIDQTMATMSNLTDKVGSFLPTVTLFSRAVNNNDLLSALLAAAISIAVFEGAYFLISRGYRKINTKLLHRHKGKDYKLTAQKSSSVLRAVAFKEWRRFVGSPVYLTNVGMGGLLGLLVAVLVLVVGPNKLAGFFANNATITFDPRTIVPIIPAGLYFFICMGNSTPAAYSLEGKSEWILKSLPISMKTVYKGKMLFNVLLLLPFFYICDILCAIACHANAAEIVMYLVLSTGMVLFATTFGMLLGTKFVNTNWENEAEVVKKGAAMTIYIFVHMAAAFASIGVSIAACFTIGGILAMTILSAVFYGLAVLFYLLLMNGKE